MTARLVLTECGLLKAAASAAADSGAAKAVQRGDFLLSGARTNCMEKLMLIQEVVYDEEVRPLILMILVTIN